MRRQSQHRFDIDVLRSLAGDKAFARGEAYHRDGQVQILLVEPQRVTARVAGTENYRTELTGRDVTVGGSCSCPAFGDWGFCKHMVATALQANEAGTGAETEGADMLARIRDHLKGKGIDALVAMMMDLAERDPALFLRLETAATVTHADDKTIEARLGRAIDSATRTRDFVDYHEAAGWAEGVNAALGAVAELVSGERAAVALRLAERAIGRIERALENIDDSDGGIAAC